jgi:hypothetical protein
MQQSPSSEANRFAASQQIPRILWNQKVHYRIHLSLSSVSSTQSTRPHLTSWRSILMLSSHLRLGLPSAELRASICSEHCLLILRRRYTTGTWYIACVFCQLAAPHTNAGAANWHNIWKSLPHLACIFLFYLAQQSQVSPNLLIHIFSRSHSTTHHSQ